MYPKPTNQNRPVVEHPRMISSTLSPAKKMCPERNMHYISHNAVFLPSK